MAQCADEVQLLDASTVRVVNMSVGVEQAKWAF